MPADPITSVIGSSAEDMRSEFPHKRKVGTVHSQYTIAAYVEHLFSSGGSDLFIKEGTQVRVKILGSWHPITNEPIQPEPARQMIMQVVPARLRDQLATDGQADFATVLTGIGRVRVNVFTSSGQLVLIARRINDKPLTLEQLNLPHAVTDLAALRSGLILITGQTGSGKSTTSDAIIDWINTNRNDHILSIEDPIETLHVGRNSIVNQREVGTDVESYKVAIKAAMRQAPSTIRIGEVRDRNEAEGVLTAAKTGHLVLTTMHTTDATETVHRMLDFFPSEAQRQVRADLAKSLRGVLSQRLIPRADQQGYALAMEVMVSKGRVPKAILDPDLTESIHEIIEESPYDGMQTFNQHLEHLIKQGIVTYDSARTASPNPDDLDVALTRSGFEIPPRP